MLVSTAGMYLNLGSKILDFIIYLLRKTSARDGKARVQELSADKDHDCGGKRHSNKDGNFSHLSSALTFWRTSWLTA